MPIMADILFFPANRASAAALRDDAQQTRAVAHATAPDAAAWWEDAAGDNGDLETMVSLAAAPSQSLAVLVAKMEMLVTRLAPDDGNDTGLCIAEVNLLRSVLRDLRSFVSDAVFAAQGADTWASDWARANLLQGSGAGSCAADSLAHYQV
jgi:hypothetical protein